MCFQELKGLLNMLLLHQLAWKKIDHNIPGVFPWYFDIELSAVGNKSIKDTAIITPAEKPKAKVKNFSFLLWVKNIIIAPTSVDKPAIVDKSNGNKDYYKTF